MKRYRPRPERRRFDSGARTTGDRSGIVGVTAHGLRIAARAAGAGAVVAYPTEAVYGLGCDPCNATAVRRILAIKGRDESKGLILIAADFSALEPVVEPLAADAMAAIQRTWPGPDPGRYLPGPRHRAGSPASTIHSPVESPPIRVAAA